MQDREKKLAIGLGVVLMFAFVLPKFQDWFLQPITEANNKLAGVETRLETLSKQEISLAAAERNLADWQYECLPPNPFTAQREYQEWLMDLARMSGFASPEATLGPLPSRGRTFIEVPVTIEAKATVEQLARFLYHFERVALLHRIQTLDVESPASIGNPLLDVTIVARGLSLIDAPQRSRLFPTTSLREDITANGVSLAIEPATGFPLIDGFQVKMGEELLTVRKRGKEKWTVERGAEQTQAVAHAAGTLVESFPIDRSLYQSGRTFDEYVELVQNSPFTKPSPPVDYEPKFSSPAPQTVTRGTPWKFKLSLTGWDPSGGPAVYALGEEVPSGLEIDSKSGELSWDAGKDVEAKTYEVPIIAKSDILSGQQVAVTVPVTLREPNLPPTIEKVEEMTAYSGRPVSMAITADDPDGNNDNLKFKLEGDVPSGAAIDEKSGELKWTPPLTLELGDYKLKVTVSDSGEPQQTASQELTVKLQDDAALFTRLVGFFKNSGTPEVMLNNLTSGETKRVQPGAEISAADISGTVLAIEPTHILLQIGQQTFRLEMGRNLRQMTPVKAAAENAPATTDSASG